MRCSQDIYLDKNCFVYLCKQTKIGVFIGKNALFWDKERKKVRGLEQFLSKLETSSK